MLCLILEDHIPYSIPNLLLQACRCSLFVKSSFKSRAETLFCAEGIKKRQIHHEVRTYHHCGKILQTVSRYFKHCHYVTKWWGGLLRLGQPICTREPNILHEGLNCPYNQLKERSIL